MGAIWTQFFPPKPTLTDTNLPLQQGRVFIVTGGTSGIGLEICTVLYGAGGKVYLAGRSELKANAAISKIKSIQTNTPGDIVFLNISLDDLATIKPAVERFTAAETRLDVLFNNAGVSNPPKGSVGKQGCELQLATNCLGPYLLTQLLLPTLVATSKAATPASTRVVWTSSIATDVNSPMGGINLKDLEDPPPDKQLNYATSKTGNWFLADALAKQAGKDGLLSITLNPGNIKSNLTRHLPRWVPVLATPLLYKPRMGAYTAIWAGFSSDLTIRDGGKYVIPWGRLHPQPRKDILEAMKTKDEGGSGIAGAFLEFCSKETSKFA